MFRFVSVLALLDGVAAHASACAGNHTREQCPTVGGIGNRCCFFAAGECQRDSPVSIGPKCFQHADLASCDDTDCCTWVEGTCASNRDKRGCKTGVEMCACHGYDQNTCEAVGCCSFVDGSCSSAVGKQKCHSREAAATTAATGVHSAGGSLAWLGWMVSFFVVVIAGAVLAKLVKRRRLGERLGSQDRQKLGTHDGGIAIAQVVDSE